jgi:hypothetical protein
LVGCRPNTKESSYQVSGVLEHTTNETFSVPGYNAGFAGFASPLNVIYGAAMAAGCKASIRVEGQLVELKKTPEFCKSAKPGQTMVVTKKVTTRISDGEITNTTYE